MPCKVIFFVLLIVLFSFLLYFFVLPIFVLFEKIEFHAYKNMNSPPDTPPVPGYTPADDNWNSLLSWGGRTRCRFPEDALASAEPIQKYPKVTLEL